MYKTDRKALRDELKGKTGPYATLLYCLLSHMRGKLHMQWYNKYHGGWTREGTRLDSWPGEMGCAYGDYAGLFTRWAVLHDLDDQAKWIRAFLDDKIYFAKYSVFPQISKPEVYDNIKEIAERVLKGYDQELAKVG